MPRYKKYIPFLVFMLLLLLSWVEESIIGEGKFHLYLLMPEHRLLRFMIRGTFGMTVFLLGFWGFSFLRQSWIIVLWIGWYIIALLAAAIRVCIQLVAPAYFSGNLWDMLSTFYVSLLTPFPYLFLLLLFYLKGLMEKVGRR